jgi:ribosome-associated heat shock protein Hsp15
LQISTQNIHTNTGSENACRLDVWLYRARLFKTRSFVAKAILKGKIRITRHGQTKRVSKPHQALRPGDLVIFMRGPNLVQVEMIAAGARRGPALEAQGLYRICEEKS